MYDLSQPNDEPGQCTKCRGSGEYRWGAVVHGQPSKSGRCYSCAGTGRQGQADIRRNRTYNKHKIARMARAYEPDQTDTAYEDQCRDMCGE